MSDDNFRGTILRPVTPQRANELVEGFSNAADEFAQDTTNDANGLRYMEARVRLVSVLVGAMERVTLEE